MEKLILKDLVIGELYCVQTEKMYEYYGTYQNERDLYISFKLHTPFMYLGQQRKGKYDDIFFKILVLDKVCYMCNTNVGLYYWFEKVSK